MIYIVSHKNLELPRLKDYRPIQVGGAPEDFPGFIRDNTGDNISEKNPGYCELTAMYWVWRNTADDYKGLVHYRRFFGRRPFSSRREDILSHDELVARLGGCDLLVARPAAYHVSAWEQLQMDCCSRETLVRLKAVFEGLHPDSMDAFRAVFGGNRISQYNMLFCRGALFDEYCAWLFPVLFTLEKQVDLAGASDYQRRLYGFLGERLMNVWIAHRGLRAGYLNVVSTEYTPLDHLTYFRRDVTNALRFRLRGKREPGME